MVVANNVLTVGKRPKVKCFIRVETVQGDIVSVMVLTSPAGETSLKVQIVDFLL